MPITDIHAHRHNRIPRAGTRIVTPDGHHGIIIATYISVTWVLLDGQRKFTPCEPKDLVREEGVRYEG